MGIIKVVATDIRQSEVVAHFRIKVVELETTTHLDTSIEARVKYDIWYIENWSLILDIRILFLTLLGGFLNDES